MRPLKTIRLSPTRALRRSVALSTRRVHRGRKRSARVGALHIRPTRRPGSFCWINRVTTAGWSRRKEKVVPRGKVRVVRPSSGVDLRPTLNTGWVCKSDESVARTGAVGAGSWPAVRPEPGDPGGGDTRTVVLSL